MTGRISARVVWALGATQVIGYGTLYYSFSVLAPAIGREFGWPSEWVYAALTAALLAGGLAAPLAGHLADRVGAARVMGAGSVAAAVTLAAAALAPGGFAYAAALIAMEIAASFVLYSTAFAALVQAGGQGAQRSITHLTLIAGFASTVFWPLTGVLLELMDWRSVYLVYAALNLLVCAPLHFRIGGRAVGKGVPVTVPRSEVGPLLSGVLTGRRRNTGFALMLLGFAIEGFILSAVLMQIMPLLQGLGLRAESLLVTSLFGPAQVLSRLANMTLGRGLAPTRIAVAAAALPAVAIVVVVLTAPSMAGALTFALLFGLGSGLTSIVAGSLPLQLLGQHGYGARLGWLSSARQIASAVSPFCLALMMSTLGLAAALWVLAVLGLISTLTFVAVAMLPPAAGRPSTMPVRAGE